MDQVDFRAVFDAIPSPYMMLDRELRYVAANPAYLAATMRDWNELRGRYLFDLFPNDGESGRRLRASFQRVLETGESDTLAFLPYAIPNPTTGEFTQAYWTAVHTPITDENGKTRFIIQNTVEVTDLARLQASTLPFTPLPGATDLLQRAREAETARQRVLEEAQEFRRYFQQAPGGFAVLWGKNHLFTFANDGFTRLVGGREIVGLTVREGLPDIAGQGFYEMLDEVFRSGKAAGAEAARVLLQASPEAPAREHFIDYTCQPVFAADGGVSGILVQTTDRTEAVRAQLRQRTLLDELNHRVKNTLATVQSIAAQTLRDGSDHAAARRAFDGRIQALSHAHNLLSENNWAGAALRDVVEQAFQPYGPVRASFLGPHVGLAPRTALTLAMVFHELTTNAAKYGALSAAGGRVDVTWQLATDKGPGRLLRIAWREAGGPRVEQPARTGFGSRLIKMSLTGELDGTAQTRFEPDGLAVDLSLPLPLEQEDS